MRVGRRYFELMVSVINPSSDLYHHSPLAPLASFDSPGSGIESTSTQSEKNCPFKDFILNDVCINITSPNNIKKYNMCVN